MKSTPLPILPASPGVLRLAAAGIADPTDGLAGPADLLVNLGPAVASSSPGVPSRRAVRVLACGRPDEVDGHPAAPMAVRVDTPTAVLLPGLVNAHTHLDLTHLGPQQHRPGDGFVAWVDLIRAGRAQEPDTIRASVRQGIARSLLGGTVLVGDIAGAPVGRQTLVPLAALGESDLRGVSYLEFFAIGPRESQTLERLADFLRQARWRARSPGVRLGLQPHAPNTVSLPAYREAIALASDQGLALCTHLAETPEEREFIATGAGAQREMLERFGMWSASVLDHVGKGLAPVEHLAPVLAEAPFLVAHVNDLSPDPDRSIEILAGTRASVVYCPRASAYFDAPAHFGPHGYREMLGAGVNVCLGTDSIVSLPPETGDPDGPGLSVLDEARMLRRRDGTDAGTLLEMATTNGARALGWDASGFSLRAGASPLGLMLVDVAGTAPGLSPMERVLASDAPARLLCLGE